ncbi:MAG: hypothetical protein ACKOX6_00970 [Bdellovibrio sp.]
MAMRLNQFQAAVCRNTTPVPGKIEAPVADALETQIAQLLVQAAKMAQQIGTDLDFIAQRWVDMQPKAADPAPAPRTPVPETSGAIVP